MQSLFSSMRCVSNDKKNVWDTARWSWVCVMHTANYRSRCHRGCKQHTSEHGNLISQFLKRSQKIVDTSLGKLEINCVSFCALNLLSVTGGGRLAIFMDIIIFKNIRENYALSKIQEYCSILISRNIAISIDLGIFQYPGILQYLNIQEYCNI